MKTPYVPKTVVGCRLSAELREQLESEAQDAGQTLSAYIETLLMRRDNVHVDVNALKMRIYLLESENREMREASTPNADNADTSASNRESATTIRTLQLQKQELQSELRRLVAERDTILRIQSDQRPAWLSPSGYEKALDYLAQIRRLHPNASPEQTLLAALALTLRNEKSLFFVLTLSDYWARYPFTPENLKTV